MRHWTIRVGLGTAFSMLADVLARAANTIFFILLARYVDQLAPGRYSLGFYFSTLLLSLAFSGFDQFLIREAARDHTLAPRLLGNLLLARTLGSLLCYLGLLAWLFGAGLYDRDTLVVVAILAATCVPESLINLYEGYLFAFERVAYITLIGGVTGVLKLIIGLAVLALGGGASGAAAVVLGASVISMILHAAVVARRIGAPDWGFDWGLWREYFRPAVVFFLIAICISIEGAQDGLLLSRTYGIAAVAIYNAAMTPIYALNILPQGFRQAILPIITRFYKSDRGHAIQIVIQSLRLMLIATLLIALTMTLASPPIFALLYRGRFADAAPVFVTLVWAFVFICCGIPNARLILAAGQQGIYVPFCLLSMLLNLALNMWLQPLLGVQGAALARLASSAFICVAGMVYAQVRVERWPIVSVVRGPLVALAAALVAALALQALRVPLALVLPVVWLVYGASLWALGVFGAEDVRRLRRLIERRVAQRVAT